MWYHTAVPLATSRGLHGRIWDVYRAATAEEFRRPMGELRGWCATRAWTAPVCQMLEKLWARTEAYAVTYAHPGCHRTSNAVDRPMNRLCRLMYVGCTATRARRSCG